MPKYFDKKQVDVQSETVYQTGRRLLVHERRIVMPIFLMFGKYSSEALKGISAERTEKAKKIIQKNGGKVKSMYAVLGEHDLVFTLEFPDAEKAMATSVALNRLTGIQFSTSPVVDVEQFDKMVGKAEEI